MILSSVMDHAVAADSWYFSTRWSVVLIVLQILYTLSAVGLALIGFNALILSILYLVHRHAEMAEPDPRDIADWPTVVVQLPIYNERYVVERLIEAVSRLDYPRHRLMVQLLDDSTDETVSRAASAVERARAAGLTIEHLRRPSREGFKAGALAYGLERTEAEFVAIFDADFVPAPDFLRRVIPHFLADERLGLVQTRWAHLNAKANILTRAQALALDGHFAVEQTARHRSGLLMNFAGTAGVWRRQCIEESGGWHWDTLSEDIDLSYRAQLKGWRFLYLPQVAVPAEIPTLMMAFKRQQARWATGTIQCLRKLGGTILRAPLSVWQKAEALIHLGGYLMHPLMLLMLLLTLPLMLSGQLSELPLAGLGIAMLGAPLEVILAQRRLYPRWWRSLIYYPMLMMIGAGIAVSNTQAILRALSGKAQPFLRTPKFEAHGDRARFGDAYALPIDATLGIEVFFALYAAAAAILSVSRLPALTPFLLLYALGFGYVAALSLWQGGRVRRAHLPRRQSYGLFGSVR